MFKFYVVFYSKPVLVFMDMCLSLQMAFNAASDAGAILIFISCTDLASSVTVASRYY